METHPNAYRAEAQQNRAEAARLIGEAERLESIANQKEGIVPKVARAGSAKAPSAPAKKRDAKGHFVKQK